MAKIPTRSGHPTLGVLLAAGSSRRFGSADKLLHPIGGKPMVQWAAEALLCSGCDQVAAIVSSADVANVLPAGVDARYVPPCLPMAVSFRAAIAEAQETGAARLLICLGDMPAVSAGTLSRLLAQPGDAACRYQDRRLPPVLLTAASFEAAARSAEDDRGARQLIATLAPSQLIALDGREATDIDLRSDLIS